jgi:two-component system, NtrC family, response regulator AtoC
MPTVMAVEGANLSLAPAGIEFVEGVSASMRPVEAVIRELAQSDVPVLVLAETGAGKRATAERIHAMSGRREQPFRWLQCLSAEPVDLEAALRNGSEGTLYLDEVADLDAGGQARILEALPRTHGHGTHGNGAHGDGVRLICGSARDLEAEVKTGRLREDLYYRISGVCLRLPPLRQRKEDIPGLMEYFLHKHAREFRLAVPVVSPATQQLFQDYAWPGNLRELEDATRVLVALGDEQIAMGGLRVLLRKPDADGGGTISLKAAARAASREAERELILKALTRTRWNRRRAAEQLQISYKALLYKLKQIRCEGYGAS